MDRVDCTRVSWALARKPAPSCRTHRFFERISQVASTGSISPEYPLDPLESSNVAAWRSQSLETEEQGSHVSAIKITGATKVSPEPHWKPAIGAREPERGSRR